jgi:hypothetical protein
MATMVDKQEANDARLTREPVWGKVAASSFAVIGYRGVSSAKMSDPRAARSLVAIRERIVVSNDQCWG